MKKLPKRRKVPAVLWRLFGDRARTLAATIASLTSPHAPPPPQSCLCSSQHCLSCCENALAFLLRPGDPSGYRKLLNQGFAVVDDGAPPFVPAKSHSWSQREILVRIVELMIKEQPSSVNVLCSGYDKFNRSSPLVELLTSSAWALLLSRVGDGVMVYLLKHTSIFLPVPPKNHQQVTGSPVSDLAFKLMKHAETPQHMDPSVKSLGKRKKRSWTGDTISRVYADQHSSPSVQVSSSCVGCNDRKNKKPFKWNKTASPMIGADITKHEELQTGDVMISRRMCSKHKHSDNDDCSSIKAFKGCSSNEHMCLNSIVEKPKKRSRLFKWLRRKKHRVLDEVAQDKKMPQQCSCCHVLQASHSLTKGAQIDKQPIFYNLKQYSTVLPPDHMLSTLYPSSAGSKSLASIIFGLSDGNVDDSLDQCSHRSDFCLIGSPCLFHSLKKSLKLLIRRSHYCNYTRLLDKHCSVNDLDVEVSKLYCSKSQVVSFIWAVCRSIVSPDMLGTRYNWRILTRNIARFIGLRRFEKFSLRQCVHELKVSEFPFLSDKHSFCRLNDVPEKSLSDLKSMLFDKWIFWFFQHLVVPLLQTHFYITESDHCKQDILYYRKSIWEKLKNKTIATLKDQNYQCVGHSDVYGIITNRLFGFSKLRLCPKENGVRMLANLKAPSRILNCEFSEKKGTSRKHRNSGPPLKYKHFRSVNNVLRDTYTVLKGIQSKEPEKLGSSVFDYNDIYEKLCRFITSLKSYTSTMPDVFVVVSDVSKAFDSINQDKLLQVMKDVIVEDEYHLQKTSQVVCGKKYFRVNQNLSMTSSSGRFVSFDSVLVNQGVSKHMTKQELFFNLHEHVKKNILQFDNAFYIQGIGIPQGSILSSLLCSMYYGHLERNVIFPFLEKTCKSAVTALQISCENGGIGSSCYLLLRLIDDFCFISTSEKQASSFYTRLQRGFRDYNCYMNERKYCVNFGSENASRLPSSRCYVGEDGVSFLRWSGLLLNSCTLEVQADYTRYLNCHLRSTLTISWHGKPAQHLKGKLRCYMRPKCHPIFFDSNINPGPVVRLNIYQAFLFCAMKFHCYVSELSYTCKLRPRFYLKIITGSFKYMYKLIKRKMRYFGCRTSHLRPVLQLELEEVEWLGLNAYTKVLKRKQSQHKKLLGLLNLKLSVHKLSQSNVSSELKYAVDSSHSSSMWQIKY